MRRWPHLDPSDIFKGHNKNIKHKGGKVRVRNAVIRWVVVCVDRWVIDCVITCDGEVGRRVILTMRL